MPDKPQRTRFLKPKPTKNYPKVLLRHLSIVVVFALLSGCDQGREGQHSELSPTLLLKACPGFAETGELMAVANAECGKLSVLENPDDPKGRRISINIQRLPAISPLAAADPLFILTGGPGQAATEFADYVAPLFRDVRKKRDIILLDQRGTGQSNPLDCEPEEEEEDWTINDAASQLKREVLLQHCLDSYDADLRFYSTTYAMADLDKVRAALGYQRINLWGVSYGTRAALVYMRDYPEQVRTAILDGSAPVNMLIPRYMERDADRALRELSEQCEASEACEQHLGNVLANVRTVMKRLAVGDVEVTVEHPLSRQATQVLISAKRFAAFVRGALYARELSPLIPLAMANAAAEDYQLVMSMIMLSSKQMESSLSQGMFLSVICSEDFSVLNQLNAQGRLSEEPAVLLKSEALGQMENDCRLWPKGAVSSDYFAPVVSAVPTLLLSGNSDPATPPRWAEDVSKNLSNSKHLVAQGGHHGISALGCVPDLMAEFIELGEHDSLDSECVKAIKPTPFFVDSMGPIMEGPALTGEVSGDNSHD